LFASRTRELIGPWLVQVSIWFIVSLPKGAWSPHLASGAKGGK